MNRGDIMTGEELIEYIKENNFFNKEFNIKKEEIDKLMRLNKKVELYDIHGDSILVGTLIEDDGDFYTIKSKTFPDGHCYNKEFYSIGFYEI